VPASLAKYLKTNGGAAVPTRFRLRLLTTRLSRKYTPVKRSPFVGPAPQAAASDGDCDGDKVKNGVDTDDDNDLLSDKLETDIHTDQCKLDTDGDGVEDGYEYQSAKDLNDDEFQEPNTDLFYPVKLPYPNPLFAGDKDTDFDGDTLTLSEEQSLWKYTINVTHTDAYTLSPLSYSDGEQYSRSVRDGSGRRQGTLTPGNDDKRSQFLGWAIGAGYRNVSLREPWDDDVTTSWTQYGLFDVDRDPTDGEEIASPDRDRDGYLSDDERDEDADGLSNYDEMHGRMRPGYWSGCYSNETPFHLGYAGTSGVDADTDGDGVRDGADDQDHDDIPNVMELSRVDASEIDTQMGFVECTKRTGAPAANNATMYGRVNPFNPCLPDLYSRTCPIAGTAATGSPFDGVTEWFALN
jgi:hypothetical protein